MAQVKEDPSVALFNELKQELESQWIEFRDNDENYQQVKDNWELLRYCDRFQRPSPKIFLEHVCYRTSAYLKSFFCGTRPEALIPEKLESNLRCINFGENPPNLTVTGTKILNDLYAQSSTHGHRIYHFEQINQYHAFVIEKFNNAGSTFYRVYESWAGKYSLAQWLGIGVDVHPIANDDCRKRAELYGMGKQLSATELEQFLSPEITSILENAGTINVDIYQVNSNRCDLVMIDSNKFQNELTFESASQLPFTSNTAYINHKEHWYYIDRSRGIFTAVSDEETKCSQLKEFVNALLKNQQSTETVIQKNGLYATVPGVKVLTLSEKNRCSIHKITGFSSLGQGVLIKDENQKGHLVNSKNSFFPSPWVHRFDKMSGFGLVATLCFGTATAVLLSCTPFVGFLAAAIMLKCAMASTALMLTAFIAGGVGLIGLACSDKVPENPSL
jgi:hypothetical protein